MDCKMGWAAELTCTRKDLGVLKNGSPEDQPLSVCWYIGQGNKLFLELQDGRLHTLRVLSFSVKIRFKLLKVNPRTCV